MGHVVAFPDFFNHVLKKKKKRYFDQLTPSPRSGLEVGGGSVGKIFAASLLHS